MNGIRIAGRRYWHGITGILCGPESAEWQRVYTAQCIQHWQQTIAKYIRLQENSSRKEQSGKSAYPLQSDGPASSTKILESAIKSPPKQPTSQSPSSPAINTKYLPNHPSNPQNSQPSPFFLAKRKPHTKASHDAPDGNRSPVKLRRYRVNSFPIEIPTLTPASPGGKVFKIL